MFILLQKISEFAPTTIDIGIILLLVICGIIAMTCLMSLVKELHDYDEKHRVFSRGSFSYSWSFGIAWASVAVALIGFIISTIGLLISPRETNALAVEAPNMSFKT